MLNIYYFSLSTGMVLSVFVVLLLTVMYEFLKVWKINVGKQRSPVTHPPAPVSFPPEQSCFAPVMKCGGEALLCPAAPPRSHYLPPRLSPLLTPPRRRGDARSKLTIHNWETVMISIIPKSVDDGLYF